MKRQVRIGVFETNSSMTHALTMCTDSEYRKWQNGEVYWDRWGHYDDDREFVPVAEIEEKYRAEYEEYKNEYEDDEDYTFDKYIGEEEGYVAYDNYYDVVGDYFETFDTSYTTPSGEVIHAFGYYGHD